MYTILRRGLLLAMVIGIAMLIASCSPGSETIAVNPLAEPTSYVPDTPVPLPDYRSDQMVMMSGTFVEIEGALVFQTVGEGSAVVGYNLDYGRFETAIEFVKGTGIGAPSAEIKGYVLNDGRLAICMADELFTMKAFRLDDCPLQ